MNEKLLTCPLDLEDCINEGLIELKDKDGRKYYKDPYDIESLIKDKSRVKSNGEVFTPEKIVIDMLDMTDKAIFGVDDKDDWTTFDDFVDKYKDVDKLREYINKTYLEPACGNGNFLVQILERKLVVANELFRRNSDKKEFTINIYKSFATIYGVDIKGDNVIESKNRMYIRFLNVLMKFGILSDKEEPTNIKHMAYFIMDRNIQLGDTLSKSYVKDGNMPMFITHILRTAKKVHGAVYNCEGDIVGHEDKIDYPNYDTSEYAEYLKNRKDNPDIEDPYTDNKRYPLLITEWQFSDEMILRTTYEFEEMEKEKQTPWQTTEDLHPISYSNLLMDIYSAQISEGEHKDLLVSKDFYTGSKDEINEAVDEASEVGEEKTKNRGIEGFINPPIVKENPIVDEDETLKVKTNSIEIAKAASEDTANLEVKKPKANKVNKKASIPTLLNW